MYVFWRYPPCDCCRTPAGIVICHLKKDDIKTWDAGELPKLILGCERLVPVLAPEALAHVEMESKLADIFDEGQGYQVIGDYFADEGCRIIGEAMYCQIGPWADWKP